MTSIPNTVREERPETLDTQVIVLMSNIPGMQHTIKSIESIEQALLDDSRIEHSELISLQESLQVLKSELDQNFSSWQKLLQMDSGNSESRSHIRRLTSLPRSVASQIVSFLAPPEEWIHLSGLLSLDPETAKVLAGWKGTQLDLIALKNLDLETATIVATWQGRVLELDGITSLDPETAAALAAWKGRFISLSGLINLDPETARALAVFKGKIYFSDEGSVDTFHAAKEKLTQKS